MRSLAIRQDHPTLASLGIATQHFPRFCNQLLNPHSVDVVLLSFIIDGTCTHMIDGDAFPSSGPTLGVTHMDQHHCILTEKDGIEITNVYLDMDRFRLPPLPRPLQHVLPRILPLRPQFANKLNRTLRVDLGTGTAAINLIRNLHLELHECRVGYEDAVHDYFRLFLIEVCRHALASGIEDSGPGHPSQERLEIVRAHLETQYHTDVSLDGLAQLVSLSPNYLCRAFKEYSGKSIITYLVERRIQAAMVLLSGTQEKILNVAFDCGFRDLSYFNRTFRKMVGMSPGQYRRKQCQK